MRGCDKHYTVMTMTITRTLIDIGEKPVNQVSEITCLVNMPVSGMLSAILPCAYAKKHRHTYCPQNKLVHHPLAPIMSDVSALRSLSRR